MRRRPKGCYLLPGIDLERAAANHNDRCLANDMVPVGTEVLIRDIEHRLMVIGEVIESNPGGSVVAFDWRDIATRLA